MHIGKTVFLIVALSITATAFGQGKYTILQTNTFHDLIGNPNLHVEKHLGAQASVSLEMMYTSHSWTWNGSLFGGGFYRANGFLIGLAPRLYFPVRKEVPNAWYMSVMLRYSLAKFSNFTYYNYDFYEDYDYRADVTESESEIGFAFGRTFYLWKPVTADVFIGVGGGYGDRKRKFIEGHYENFREFGTYGLGKFYFGFKVGYCFGAKESSKTPADQ